MAANVPRLPEERVKTVATEFKSSVARAKDEDDALPASARY